MKVAIIGFGGIGEHHYLKTCEYNTRDIGEKIEVIGIFDNDFCVKSKAEKYNLKFYSDSDEVFKDKNIEAVIIAVPNDCHLFYVESAAKNGKNIICEKPVALNTNEFIRMREAADKFKVKFTVHQNRRWDKDYLIIKNIMQNNLIGNFTLIESNVTGSNGIPGGWRKKTACGGGMMLDWGVHLIDQLVMLDLGDIDYLYCGYSFFYGEEVEDGFTLFLTYKNGLKAEIKLDTNSFKNLPRWRICGENGGAIIENWECQGGITTVKDRFDKNLKGITAGNGYTKTMAARSLETVENIPLPECENMNFEFYRNFIAACRNKEQLHVKYDEVLKTFKIMEAANISAKKHKIVKL